MPYLWGRNLVGSQVHTTEDKWPHDPNGESVLNPEVTANFMMKRSQQKATFLTALLTFMQTKIS